MMAQPLLNIEFSCCRNKFDFLIYLSWNSKKKEFTDLLGSKPRVFYKDTAPGCIIEQRRAPHHPHVQSIPAKILTTSDGKGEKQIRRAAPQFGPPAPEVLQETLLERNPVKERGASLADLDMHVHPPSCKPTCQHRHFSSPTIIQCRCVPGLTGAFWTTGCCSGAFLFYTSFLGLPANIPSLS